MSGAATAIIVGGSSGLGRALAELLAEKGYSLALVSRDQEDLEVMKTSLETTFGHRVYIYPADLLASDFDVDRLVERVQEDLGTIGYAFLVAGGSFEGDEKVPTQRAFKNALRLNYESMALIANALLSRQATNQCCSILFVSSIAAVAPRSLNSSYAAAKKALETYTSSLRHHCFQAQVPTNIQVIRLGYMESGFTRGKTLLFPIAAPSRVAKFIFEMKDRDYGIQIFPRFWILILFIISRLPWAVYKRLRF